MGVIGDKLVKIFSTTAAQAIESTLKATSEISTTEIPGDVWKALREKTSTDLSIMGGIIGAPLGLFPVLSTMFSAGWGKEAEFGQARVWKTGRLQPMEIINHWFRSGKPEDYDFSPLNDLGWDDNKIEAFKLLFKSLPSMIDVVRFGVREAYDPAIVEKYEMGTKLDAVYSVAKPDIDAAGFDYDTFAKYWYSHWVLPAVSQGFTMLHRGEISEEELRDLMIVLDIMPGWIPKLENISWDIPNRIELRMMTRYLNLNKSYLVERLKEVGLHEQFRSDVADFMLIMAYQTDFSKRFSKGWINEEQLKAEIAATGIAPVSADKLYKWIVAVDKPERVEEQRKLSQAIIIKGVKKEYITPEEGVQLLVYYQNYGFEEAQFIMDVELGALGSPETPLEFRKLAEEYRASQGLSFKEIPKDAIDLEKALFRLKERLKEAVEKGESQEIIDQLKADLASDEVKLTLLKAEYELA